MSANNSGNSNHFNNSNFENKSKSWRFQTKNKPIGAEMKKNYKTYYVCEKYYNSRK